MMPRPTKQPPPSPTDEEGQALVELMLIVLVTVMVGFGIYEAGALLHNISVMNKAMNSASNYAARGATYERIQEQVSEEAENLLSGAFLAQTVTSDPGLVLEVWNPETGTKLGTHTGSGHTYRSQCPESFAPGRQGVTPYIFWAQGYELRVGVRYEIGFYVPFLAPVTIDTVVSGSTRIAAQNDLDRDGLVDSREAEYVDWAMTKKANASGMISDTQWKHPVHRDEYDTLDSNHGPTLDIDDDGVPWPNDDQLYDRDNDGTEDKFDKAEASDRDNHLTMNPLVGPGVRPDANDNKWWAGRCP